MNVISTKFTLLVSRTILVNIAGRARAKLTNAGDTAQLPYEAWTAANARERRILASLISNGIMKMEISVLTPAGTYATSEFSPVGMAAKMPAITIPAAEKQSNSNITLDTSDKDNIIVVDAGGAKETAESLGMTATVPGPQDTEFQELKSAYSEESGFVSMGKPTNPVPEDAVDEAAPEEELSEGEASEEVTYTELLEAEDYTRALAILSNFLGKEITAKSYMAVKNKSWAAVIERYSK